MRNKEGELEVWDSYLHWIKQIGSSLTALKWLKPEREKKTSCKLTLKSCAAPLSSRMSASDAPGCFSPLDCCAFLFFHLINSPAQVWLQVRNKMRLKNAEAWADKQHRQVYDVCGRESSKNIRPHKQWLSIHKLQFLLSTAWTVM